MRHRLTRRLPWSAEQLFDLVSDVESYPRFVRWIETLRTWDRRSDSDGVDSLDAEAVVRFGPLRERFATSVRLDRPGLAIDVTLLSGPFRRLENHWRFTPLPTGSELAFDIDFELRSALLRALLAANFSRAAETLVGCFEARAAELYGGTGCRAGC